MKDANVLLDHVPEVLRKEIADGFESTVWPGVVAIAIQNASLEHVESYKDIIRTTFLEGINVGWQVRKIVGDAYDEGR